MEPIITTVIPTFQRPTLLRRAIDSVLSQTFPHFQVYVCDNNSSVETENIVREFIERDSRIKYHRHDRNIGMMANYQYGYSKISTPYFSFLSDDDYYSSHFFESGLESLTQFPHAAFSIFAVHAINCNEEVILNSLCMWEKKGYFDSPEGFLEMITPILKTPIPTCALFNRTILGEISPEWDEQIQHLWDHNFFLKVAAQLPYVVNEKVCGYFLAHDEGFSSGFFDKLQRSPTELDKYLQAAYKLIQNTSENPHLSPKNKAIAKYQLRKFFRNHISFYLPKYKLPEVISTVKLMARYLGFDKNYLRHLMKSVCVSIKK